MNADGGTYGYSDWRLPNVGEMYSLFHFGFYDPALSDATGTNKWTEARGPFTGVQSDYYWVGTTYVSEPDKAWNAHLYSGSVYHYNSKTSVYYVWPVRGGP